MKTVILTFAVISASVSAAPQLPPEQVDFSVSDLEQQHKEQTQQNREAQARWSEWQARMRSDFERAIQLNSSPEIVSEAMSRFLNAYSANNPFSAEDERLRGEAIRRRDLALKGEVDLIFDTDIASLAYERAPSVIYPPISLRLREMGDVIVEMIVDMNGAVVSATIHRSSGYPRLDAAAREAALKAKFRPLELGARVYRARVMVPFSFRFDS